jgi:phospholipase/lecithinase/hemolysin
MREPRRCRRHRLCRVADLRSGDLVVPDGRGVNFIPADISGLFTYVSQNPAKFGFAAATYLASNPACGATSSLLCGPGQLVTANAEQTHLWADDVHLTSAGRPSRLTIFIAC